MKTLLSGCFGCLLLGLTLGSVGAAPQPTLPGASLPSVATGPGQPPPCVCAPATGLPATGGFLYHCQCGSLRCVVAGTQGGTHHLVCPGE